VGAYSAEWLATPAAFTGMWYDMNYLGSGQGALPVMLTTLLQWALGPVSFSKFYVFFTLLFMGSCAWLA